MTHQITDITGVVTLWPLSGDSTERQINTYVRLCPSGLGREGSLRILHYA